MADLALLLRAQDVVELDAGNGGEARAFAGRLDGKAGVVVGQIDLADEGVGRLDVGHAGERDLVDEPVLQRPEGPLGAPARLRRIGPDMLNPDPRAVTRGPRPTCVKCPRSISPPALAV
jgi:hypothetical protein